MVENLSTGKIFIPRMSRYERLGGTATVLDDRLCMAMLVPRLK